MNNERDVEIFHLFCNTVRNDVFTFTFDVTSGIRDPPKIAWRFLSHDNGRFRNLASHEISSNKYDVCRTYAKPQGSSMLDLRRRAQSERGQKCEHGGTSFYSRRRPITSRWTVGLSDDGR